MSIWIAITFRIVIEQLFLTLTLKHYVKLKKLVKKNQIKLQILKLVESDLKLSELGKLSVFMIISHLKIFQSYFQNWNILK